MICWSILLACFQFIVTQRNRRNIWLALKLQKDVLKYPQTYVSLIFKSLEFSSLPTPFWKNMCEQLKGFWHILHQHSERNLGTLLTVPVFSGLAIPITLCTLFSWSIPSNTTGHIFFSNVEEFDSSPVFWICVSGPFNYGSTTSSLNISSSIFFCRSLFAVSWKNSICGKCLCPRLRFNSWSLSSSIFSPSSKPL